MPISFIEQRNGEDEEIVKSMSILSGFGQGQEDALISSFLQLFIGGYGQIVSLWVEKKHLNIQAEGQGSLRQAIMYDYNNGNEKHKLKKQVQ